MAHIIYALLWGITCRIPRTALWRQLLVEASLLDGWIFKPRCRRDMGHLGDSSFLETSTWIVVPLNCHSCKWTWGIIGAMSPPMSALGKLSWWTWRWWWSNQWNTGGRDSVWTAEGRFAHGGDIRGASKEGPHSKVVNSSRERMVSAGVPLIIGLYDPKTGVVYWD